MRATLAQPQAVLSFSWSLAGSQALNELPPDFIRPAPLEIPREHHDAMVAHCLREAPLECCGILGGVTPLVSSFHPLQNAAASESRYDADPRDLIKAVIALRERGEEILAIYHSHPRWAAVPSRTDLRENYYGPVPRIIVSLLNAKPVVRVWRLETYSYLDLKCPPAIDSELMLRVWRLDCDSFEELPWRIIERALPAEFA